MACNQKIGPDFVAAVKAAGGRALPLAVSGAFHSPYMEDASKALGEAFSGLSFASPRIPVIANMTAEVYESVEQMFGQVCHPVQWQKTVELLWRKGVDTFVEVGPGKTLCGLVSKTLPEARILNVENEETLNHTWEVLSSC